MILKKTNKPGSKSVAVSIKVKFGNNTPTISNKTYVTQTNDLNMGAKPDLFASRNSRLISPSLF